MKKIISTVAIATIISATGFGQVNATMDNQANGSNGMMNMNTMKGMNSEMMTQMDILIKKISDNLNEDGKKRLESMKVEHMSDMMKFMKKFPGMIQSDEKMNEMNEIKKEHLSDLKEILKDNLELYSDISVKMEKIMDTTMGYNSTKGMKGGDEMMNMNGVNKRMFSSKTQNKIDTLITKLFLKLDKLDVKSKNKRITSILNKIGNAKSKSKIINDESKREKINSILDYLTEKIKERSGIGMMGGMSGMKMGNMNGMNGGMMGGTIDNSVLMETKENLMKAKKVEVVELKDGDSYTMEVTQVEKEIGNAKVVMLAYNGSIPGPVIKVAKDSRITLKLVNKVKDLKTTLHSHGLRLDNEMDGVPDTMRGKQKEMEYGDVFEYTLDFPDEGVYWYHPHVREDLQQELGLYGNYIVEPTKTDYWAKVNREETLILDDILMENDKIASITDKFANYVMMGRYGNTMLVNGDTNYNLKAKKGESVRMYFTNVANTRVFQVAIPGAKMKLVGGDIGKYEREEMIDSFIMAPAERYIVDVFFDKSGTFEILNKNPEFTKKLGTITVSNEEIDKSYKSDFDTLRVNDDVISDIDNFRKYFDTKPDKYLDLSIGMKDMKMGNMGGESDGDTIEWFDTMGQMNKMSNSDMVEWKFIDKENGNENMDINWKFKVGDKVKVRIYNDPDSMHPMQHPIHFHGQRFLVVSENGKTPDNMVWKDTALVKTGEYIDIVIDMTNPGDWMSHCHIAEHLSAGMMMSFKVEE